MNNMPMLNVSFLKINRRDILSSDVVSSKKLFLKNLKHLFIFFANNLLDGTILLNNITLMMV